MNVLLNNRKTLKIIKSAMNDYLNRPDLISGGFGILIYRPEIK